MTATKDSTIRKYKIRIMLLCAIGFVLSYYSYIVKAKKEMDDSYKAMCDISENISCTKVFMSEYGKGFGLVPKNSIFNIPNSMYGLVYYTHIAITSLHDTYNCSVILVMLAIFSNICSVYLAYILYTFKDICIVCISTYIINALVAYLAIKKFQILHNSNDAREKKVK